MSYEHLKLEERYVIAHLIIYGLSIREIGRRIQRSASTIVRELKRNKGQYQKVYWYEEAQACAQARRTKRRQSTKQSNNQYKR